MLKLGQRLALGIVVFFALFWFSSSGIKAATFTVTKTADTLDGVCDADCSLREAIVAANASAGADTIEFNIPTGDSGYVPASGSTHAYWLITSNFVTAELSDDAGVFINGYSQPGSSRNTAAFGEPINAVLRIQIFTPTSSSVTLMTGDNNHLAGLNVSTTRTADGQLLISGSNGNWIEGNFFGSDITGTTTSGGGAFAFTGTANDSTFGTNGDGVGDVGERNLFMGSVSLRGHITTANSNNDGIIISGNYFGVTKTGRSCSGGAVAQTVMWIAGTGGVSDSNIRVGTNYDGISDSEESNIIACINTNVRGLIYISETTKDTVIQGNYIGTNPYLDSLSNFGTPGIRLGFAGTGQLVLQNIIVKGNTIAHNNGAGITVYGVLPNPTGLTFTENIIRENSGLPIDLNNNGLSANDPGDADVGPNELMNYPVITNVSYLGSGQYRLEGTMDGNPSEAPFTIEVFRSDDGVSGHGGALAYLGSVSTSSSSWTLDVGIAGDYGDECRIFSSTATNAGGSTSEFGANFRRGNCPVPAGAPAGPDYLSGAPQPTTVGEEGDVVSLVPANSFQWDAYLWVNEIPKTGSFRIPGTLYWQATSKYEVWWKAFANDAKIVSSEVLKPFTLVFNYQPESFEKTLSENNLKLAYSSDGKTWQILSNTILNTQNNTLSVVTKSGGYYMLVSGYSTLGFTATEFGEFSFPTPLPESKEQTQVEEEPREAEVTSEPQTTTTASQLVSKKKIAVVLAATVLTGGALIIFRKRRKKDLN